MTPEGGGAAAPGAAKSATTLSWQDIVVVPRKAFLKGSRAEFAPFSGLTLNDNLIRHYVFGGDINFFLSAFPDYAAAEVLFRPELRHGVRH